MSTVGLLHPGAMGSALASVLVSQGLVVIGASEGRSPASRARAAEAGMQDRGSLAAVATEAEVIVSVCPPGRAEELAQLVEQAGFGGLYVDANAVAPATARRIAQRFPRFADGGIIGPPPWLAGTTRLYVSGPEAALVAQLFASGPLDVRLVEGEPGAASAVKVCYAAWTKGTSAVLLSIRALAVAEGVTGPLLDEWQISMPGLARRSAELARDVGPKAWRFEDEMLEIAASLAQHDLPVGFHQAAAEVYRRLASLKGSPEPSLDEALHLLLDQSHPDISS